MFDFSPLLYTFDEVGLSAVDCTENRAVEGRIQ